MKDFKDFKEIEHYEEEKIKELLLYRKVIKVSEDTILLDNGIEL